MRNIVDYKVEFFDGKKEREVVFKIKRIPQSVLTEYSELSITINNVYKKSKRIGEIIDEMGSIIVNKDDDAKQKIKDLKQEKKEIESEISSIDHKTFFETRHQLIKKLLEKNGITDELYLSREFWEDYVDSTDLNTFLESVVYKDMQVKKKAL